MSIDAGRLRHHVALDRLVDLLDSNGEVVQDPSSGEIPKVWEFVANVWAAIEPMSVRELLLSQQVMSKATTKMIIWYREDVDFTWRARHKNKIYAIDGTIADKDSNIEYLTLAVHSGTNQG